MSIVVKENGGRSAPLEAGTYPARCVGVIDLGVQHNDFNSKDQEQVRLIFELPTERTEYDGEDRPRWLSKAYTASLHEKSTLRKHLEAWRGRAFTAEELMGFDLRDVLGKPCMVGVKASEKGKAKLDTVSKVMKGVEVPPQENETLSLDMDDPEGAMKVFQKLPDWMKGEIEKSATWEQVKRGTSGGNWEEDPDDDGDCPF